LLLSIFAIIAYVQKITVEALETLERRVVWDPALLTDNTATPVVVLGEGL
jgi:hypothetical protein